MQRKCHIRFDQGRVGCCAGNKSLKRENVEMFLWNFEGRCHGNVLSFKFIY